MAGIEPKVDNSALLARLKAAKPTKMSQNDWCKAAEVNTSFFTSLQNGREPGFYKVKRMASVAGLSVAEVAGEARPTQISAAVLARILQDLVPLAPQGELTDSAAEALAVALRHALAYLQASDAIEANEDQIEAAARAAVVRFREAFQP